MSSVRRTRYVSFFSQDAYTVDPLRLLGGEIELVPITQLFAVPVLTGQPVVISFEELELAHAVPEAWTACEELLARRPAGDAERLGDLIRQGIVVSDDPDPDPSELRRRDETLSKEKWSAPAAAYHFIGKWRDVQVDPGPDPRTSFEDLLELAATERERLGPAPPAFVSDQSAVGVSELPIPPEDGALYEILRRRRTSRAFDGRSRMTRDQLATVLYYVWGCHGVARVSEDITLLKKTSPSGGGLHPIEVYPLVRDVDGLEPGLYHYRLEDHALEQLSAVTAAEAGDLAGEFTAGQTYFQSAHVLFLMTARFFRSFWRYRNHRRAYGVLLMDAGHLSQTLYLVCAELGLGAFVTAAINAANIEERLGLDGYEEGALAVCGCGISAPAGSRLEPSFQPFFPARRRSDGTVLHS